MYQLLLGSRCAERRRARRARVRRSPGGAQYAVLSPAMCAPPGQVRARPAPAAPRLPPLLPDLEGTGAARATRWVATRSVAPLSPVRARTTPGRAQNTDLRPATWASPGQLRTRPVPPGRREWAAANRTHPDRHAVAHRTRHDRRRRSARFRAESPSPADADPTHDGEPSRSWPKLRHAATRRTATSLASTPLARPAGFEAGQVRRSAPEPPQRPRPPLVRYASRAERKKPRMCSSLASRAASLSGLRSRRPTRNGTSLKYVRKAP